MFVIIKHVKNTNGRKLPVILLDSQGEVWEFDSSEKAEYIKDILEKNSDSGHKYEVKKL